jgi:TolB protein
MGSDGKNPEQLTNDSSGVCPSWFPEGDRIAFLSVRDTTSSKGLEPGKLWAIAVESGRQELLMELGEDVGYARLSPDGKDVALNSNRSGTLNVWTIPLAGGVARQLTFDKEMAGFPYWSPDGQLLAFQMKRGDDTHISVTPSDGGEITQLTFDRGQSWTGDWSPDGEKISFAGERNGYWNVWWVSRSAKKQKQVTNYAKLNSYVRYPSWSPLGNQIVYEYAETTGNIWLMELR